MVQKKFLDKSVIKVSVNRLFFQTNNKKIMAKKSSNQGSRRSSSSTSSSTPKKGSQRNSKPSPSKSNSSRSNSRTSNSGVGPSSFSKGQLFQIISIQRSSGQNVRLEYRNPNFDVNSFSRASIEEEAVRVRGNRTWNDFKRMVK